MRKISFVNRLTVWYSIILIIIAVGSMALLWEMGKQRVEDTSLTALVEQVSEMENRLTEAGGDFEYSIGLRFYSDDVYISIYDEDGTLIEGRWPAGVSTKPDFTDREKKTVSDSSGDDWYIYDSLCKVDGRTVWIRGITEGRYGRILSGFMWPTAVLSLLGLLLAAIVIGRIIAVRSLQPVRNIISTVEGIRNSGDLSRRVEYEGKDDLGQLAENFNRLFDKVEVMVDKEKQFTADVSHELKTPLAVITSQSEYALEDSEYAGKALKTINSEAKRMDRMIGSLRMLAGSDSGNMTLAAEPVDLSELCTSIADSQKLIGQSLNITVEEEIEENIIANADTTLVIRSILNLIDNAFKYAGEGSTVVLGLHGEGNEAVCTVSDNGPGIREENLDKIWDRFYREDKSRSSRDSWGLGLSMVRAIVEAHGGSVSVESSENKGCSFIIRLPKEEKTYD